MNRDAIEEKDQRLMKKFRAIVDKNKQTAAPSQTRNPRGVMLITGLLVAGLILLPVWLLSKDKPLDSASMVREDVAAQDAPVLEESIPATEPALASPEPESREAEPLPVTKPSIEKSLPAPSEPVPAPEMEKVAMDAPAPVSGVSIADMKVCQGVVDRECMSPTLSFLLSGKVKPTVWMTVMAENPPFTLTHAYYLNGQPYCTVPLTIGYPRTRTWSRITVNQEIHLGAWRVDVVDDNGRVLKQIAFDVVP